MNKNLRVFSFKMSDVIPDVTGISPKEAKPGTKLTIRGNNFGKSPSDLVAVYVCGKNCSSSAEWQSERKIICRVAADCEGNLSNWNQGRHYLSKGEEALLFTQNEVLESVKFNSQRSSLPRSVHWSNRRFGWTRRPVLGRFQDLNAARSARRRKIHWGWRKSQTSHFRQSTLDYFPAKVLIQETSNFPQHGFYFIITNRPVLTIWRKAWSIWPRQVEEGSFLNPLPRNPPQWRT